MVGQPLLRVEGLVCGYNGWSVGEASFSLAPGEVLFLLGPIGSGKTTLLRCLAGLLEPLKGRAVLLGQPIHQLAPRARARLVAYVPQHPPRAPLTVLETVLLGRYPYTRSPSRVDAEKALEILDALGIRHLAGRPLASLSGGQLQKAMLARALAQEPRLLLLDEPTSSLDLRSALEVMTLLTRVAREKGIAAIIATHDLNHAMHYADKVLLVRDGRIVAYGSRETLTRDAIAKTYGVEVEVVELHGRRVVVPVPPKTLEG